MKQSLFTKYLNDLLNVEQFAGKDFCPNGLLVDATGDPDHKIEKVVTGVSLRDALIEKAIEAKADAIVVHHPNGFWKCRRSSWGHQHPRRRCRAIRGFGVL